jgi:hypothetical protein
MTSEVTVSQIQDTDLNGSPLYKEITRKDSLGNTYSEYKPIYKMNSSGNYYYNYSVKRIPMLKYGFLSTESSMQDFIFVLEERRKYMEECLVTLEDTFSVDFKFVNTYGPSNRFYYILPTETSYNAKVATKKLYVYSDLETETVIGEIALGEVITIKQTDGLWGKIDSPYEGWVRLADTSRCINYIDNVAISLKFALEAESSSDKSIASHIVDDIKEYIETINEINEIHMPNIVTLITNNYREQLKYFEFQGVNNYGPNCQHLYLDESIDADVCPEFINVATSDDKTLTPDVTIVVY